VITKLDGNAKGGVAIAVAFGVKTPIMLAGLGESPGDLIDFDPVSFVRSLLPEK
jgi:fused signal recognition particle receptor